MVFRVTSKRLPEEIRSAEEMGILFRKKFVHWEHEEGFEWMKYYVPNSWKWNVWTAAYVLTWWSEVNCMPGVITQKCKRFTKYIMLAFALSLRLMAGQADPWLGKMAVERLALWFSMPFSTWICKC